MHVEDIIFELRSSCFVFAVVFALDLRPHNIKFARQWRPHCIHVVVIFECSRHLRMRAPWTTGLFYYLLSPYAQWRSKKISKILTFLWKIQIVLKFSINNFYVVYNRSLSNMR